MRLFYYELKKIWNPIILGIIILLGVIFYSMFPSFYIQYFNNGSDHETSFALSSEWASKYGTTMEPYERTELNAQLAEEQKLFAAHLTAIDVPSEYGFSDWDSFSDFEQTYFRQVSKDGSKADLEIEGLIRKTRAGTNYYTIQKLMNIMNLYDNLDKWIPYTYGDTARQEKISSRVNEIKASDMWHGYLPSGILDTTNNYIELLTVWSILSVVLLLSPTLVRDRLRRVRAMQWSSKKGRQILNTQLLAAGVSAFVLSLVNLIIYAIPFILQKPLIFKDFTLFSFQIFYIPWYNFTYGQYLIVMALMIIAIGMGAAGLTVFLSQYSGNYVSMLLKALPLFAVLAYISSNFIMHHAFFTVNILSSILGVPSLPAILALSILALSVSLQIYACKRQLKRELL